MNRHLAHKRSSESGTPDYAITAKLPTSGDVVYGEIAVNYGQGHETISLRNSNNEIVPLPNNETMKNEIGLSSWLRYSSTGATNIIKSLNPKSVLDEVRKVETLINTPETTYSNIPSGTTDEIFKKNIVSATSAGTIAYANLEYDEANNKLKFTNTRAYKEIQLSNGGSDVSVSTYLSSNINTTKSATINSYDLYSEKSPLEYNTTSSTGIQVKNSGNQAKGHHSVAGGFYTEASGMYSHTEGYSTQAKNENEFACGKFNLSNEESTLFSVGIGTSNADRKNAFEVTSDGIAYVSNDLVVNNKNILNEIENAENGTSKIVSSAGLSGSVTSNTVGYSAHTTPSFISTQNPSTIQTEIVAVEKSITPTNNTDATVRVTPAYVQGDTGYTVQFYQQADCVDPVKNGENYSVIYAKFYGEPTVGTTLTDATGETTATCSINSESGGYCIVAYVDFASPTQTNPIKQGMIIPCYYTYDESGTTLGANTYAFGTLQTIEEKDNAKNNIVSVTSNGIEAFADLEYTSSDNRLRFVNTNGYKDIMLNQATKVSVNPIKTGGEKIATIKINGVSQDLYCNYPVSGDDAVNVSVASYKSKDINTDTIANITVTQGDKVISSTNIQADRSPFKHNATTYSGIQNNGDYTEASGYYSLAFGEGARATKSYSCAIGKSVTSDNTAEFSCGKYNKSASDTLFSVGNGTSTSTSNAFEVKENGDAYVTNDLYIKGELLNPNPYTGGTNIEIKDNVINSTTKFKTVNGYTITGGTGTDNVDIVSVKEESHDGTLLGTVTVNGTAHEIRSNISVEYKTEGQFNSMKSAGTLQSDTIYLIY